MDTLPAVLLSSPSATSVDVSGAGRGNALFGRKERVMACGLLREDGDDRRYRVDDPCNARTGKKYRAIVVLI